MIFKHIDILKNVYDIELKKLIDKEMSKKN